MAAAKNIRATCGTKNPPGLSSTMWITKKSEVTAITAATAGKIAGASAFTMATTPAAGSWNVFELSPVPGKKTFAAPLEGETGNKFWKPEVTGYINGITGAKSAILESFVGCECLVIIKTKGGKRFLIGDLDDGLYLDVIPGINGEANGYEIKAMSELSGYIPYELDDDVTLTVAADV